MSKEVLVLRGTLEGHNGAVTASATTPADPDFLVSASRDKTLIIWQLTRDEQAYGVPKKSSKGHSHIVQDCCVSFDGKFVFSASWDKTIRSWDLETDESTRFVGHTGDVLSVSSSSDSRQIFSGSRDKTIKAWNTAGECKFTFPGHNDWVSCVRFCPPRENENGEVDSSPSVISSGWDKVVKSWDMNEWKLGADFIGHTGYINNITISPDGTLCASGGKDGSILIWDLGKKSHLFTLLSGDEVYASAFSPNRYWSCAATSSSIKIFNLEARVLIDESKPDFASASAKSREPECISSTWSQDGQNSYAGYTDNLIRVWQVMRSS